MTRFFPKTASAQQVQHYYRSLFDEVISSREPLVILNNNKPEVIVIDIESYEEMRRKAQEYDRIIKDKFQNL